MSYSSAQSILSHLTNLACQEVFFCSGLDNFEDQGCLAADYDQKYVHSLNPTCYSPLQFVWPMRARLELTVQVEVFTSLSSISTTSICSGSAFYDPAPLKVALPWFFGAQFQLCVHFPSIDRVDVWLVVVMDRLWLSQYGWRYSWKLDEHWVWSASSIFSSLPTRHRPSILALFKFSRDLLKLLRLLPIW